MIALNAPLKPDLEKVNSYLKQVNDSGWYTNFGPLHEQLTRRLENFLGVENLLLVSNGTIAIQVACKALGIDSVITTPFTFVATSSSLLWQGVNLAYSDIDPQTYNLCPVALDKSLKEFSTDYNGIVATHVYGNPCDVQNIAQVAKKYDQKVVYDSAHAFGVKLDGKSILSYGDASTLSFHATKVFHTVEGGAIVFKSKKAYQKAKQLINFGIEDDGVLGEPGINAKLNEYQCAVGLTLLDDMETVIEYRASLFSQYRELLKGYVHLPEWYADANYNGAYMPIYIEDANVQEVVLSELKKNNIQSRRYFVPSLDVAYDKQRSFGCKNSHKITGGVICLPLHRYLSNDNVTFVCEIIRRVINEKSFSNI